MSVKLVKQAVKELIDDNAIMLCGGIVHQGIQRQIAMLSTSELTPMPDHYAIYVASKTSGYGKLITKTSGPGTGQKGQIVDVTILIYDEAVLQANEDEAFEKVNEDFDLFVDRVGYLVLDTGRITLSDGKRTSLVDDGELNAVDRSDMSGQWVESEDEVGNWLVAQLKFSLRCNCASDLY